MRVSMKISRMGAALSLSCALGLVVPAGSASAAVPSVRAVEVPSLNVAFQPCQGVRNGSIPRVINVGESLGAGVTESLTPQMRLEIRRGLVGSGRPDPRNLFAVRHLDSGEILLLDEQGRVISRLGGHHADSSGAVGFGPVRRDRDRPGDPGPGNPGINYRKEVKRIVGACLGVGSVSGMTFEQLVRWLATPSTAVKFVVRRIGLAAAVGCIGGIIWEYL